MPPQPLLNVIAKPTKVIAAFQYEYSNSRPQDLSVRSELLANLRDFPVIWEVLLEDITPMIELPLPHRINRMGLKKELSRRFLKNFPADIMVTTT